MSDQNLHVLIIGAGFAGIGLAHRLMRGGLRDFTILERAPSVGGTWRDNTYPGLACDIPSHLYSYSFAPNPDWSRFFAPQPEIRAYLERCADMHGIRSHIRFEVGAIRADFDEGTGLWTVQTTAGPITARFVVSGAGHALSQPVYPDIPGRASFAGKTMHSARWDGEYPLEGKAVAVIGTGASAVQIVPAIASRVGSLGVYQRTPAWVFPKPDWPTSKVERRLYRRIPPVQRLMRGAVYSIFESFALGHVFAPRLNAIHDWRGRRFLASSVRDRALREKLTPDFRFGCKRILLSNEYYPALQRENVELITDTITEIRPHAIATADGKVRPVDVIAYATGFVAAEAAPPFAIHGRGGRTLEQAWNNGGEAYLGTTVTGFPNLFLMIGPNLGLGHNSMIFMMESQFNYVIDAIRTLRRRRVRFMDVRADAQARHNAWLQKRLARSVWNTGGCRSWYLTKGGKNTTTWPGFTFEFFARTRRFDVERYELGGAW
ncbi:MAG: NAD(P)/FAD-dependent oxidoreductase [Pseudomonadota bacterium]|nr:NAD(P)/FAD-dependent oxidoreductase [Pseudomonadota bacterium]